jgi:predicted nucleic acid-binding protein
MGRLTDRLKHHTVIGLDTPVFIYHLEAHPRYLPLTQELLTGVQAGHWAAHTSTVTLMELTVRPWQLQLPGVAREYEALLVHFPHLDVADVTRDIARQDAQLRARHRVRPVDAIQLATALVHRATAFVTNDAALTRLTPLLDVVLLNDLT